MKRTLIIVFLITISLTGIFAMDRISSRKGMQHGNDIEKLWKEYESAKRSDRPSNQMDILKRIMELSKEDKLPWDFYKASQENYSVGISRNWKLADSLETEMKRSLEDFGSAIISFYTRKSDLDGMSSFLEKNRKELESGHNSGFYKDDGSIRSGVCPEVLTERFGNDYEYALWSVFLGQRWSSSRFSDEYRECEGMLDEALEGRYPEAAIKEYELISRKGEESRYDELKAFADRYEGKAVSLLAQQDILVHEFEVMEDGSAGSEEFKALRARCEAFEKERGKYSGIEKKTAEACTRVKMLIGSLDEKSISAHIEDNVLTVLLRNLDKASVSLEKDGKKTFSKTLDNTVRSYYIYDTLTFELPVMDDGEYDLICENGKQASRSKYSRYTISVASRIDAEGPAVFVADAVTGKPLSAADISLLGNKDAVKAEINGFKPGDGFTYLPKAFKDPIDKDSRSSLRIQVRYKDAAGILHLSQKANIGTAYAHDNARTITDRVYGEILTDRGAFSPEETVQFKGLVYHGDIQDKISVMDAGEKVSVRLYDAESNILKSEEYTTNGFGSVAGSFFLPRQERNGMYRMELVYKEEILDYVSLRVDDFVLPTFFLSFDEGDTLLLPGDDVMVSGRIMAYSGHTLSNAKATYILSKNWTDQEEKELQMEADGRFCISFPSDDESSYQSYQVTVKVVDNTGETHEWSTTRHIDQRIPLHIDIANKAEGRMETMKLHEYHPDEDYSTELVSGDEIRFSFEHWGKTRDDMEIEYTLSSAGNIIASGKASCGESKVLSLKGHPSGLYTLASTAKVKSRNGKEYVSKSVCDILMTNDDDLRMNAEIENVFKVLDNGRTGLLVGSTAADTWIAIDLYATGNVRLAHRMVHLEKKKELEPVEFFPDAGWSDVVKVTAIYFRNNRCYSYEHDFDIKGKMMQLPLRFTRFEDRTRPAAPYSFEIQTLPGVECAASVFDKSTETIRDNAWRPVHIFSRRPNVRSMSTNGINSSTDRFYSYDAMYGAANGVRLMKSASVASAEAAVNDEIGTVKESIPYMNTGETDDGQTAPVRENFANTIAFEPMLRSGGDGRMEFSFTTADKLSTYVVQLFAHDKDMKNNVIREEMTVTIPVKVSVAEPQSLYIGDMYNLKASVSSQLKDTVKGRLRAEFYNSGDHTAAAPVKVMEIPVELGPMESGAYTFSHDLTEAGTLGVKLMFTSDDAALGSDALFVSIPVLRPVQTIMETHSSLLRDGDDKDSLISQLRNEFINMPGMDAEVKELSILQMIKDAVPEKVEPESQNVLDLSESLYIRRMAERLLGKTLSVEKSDDEIISSIMSCKNDDGGFGWFKGFGSSPVITAALLERLASIKEKGFGEGLEDNLLSASTIKDAVRYLDEHQFSKDVRPVWCGGISFEQYLSVRTMFSDVPFDAEGLDKAALADFKKQVKDFLLPDKERALNGMILSKARRIKVLMELTRSEGGLRLASSWGIGIFAKKRLENSVMADISSLMEYAVEHKSGGWYYPNAVMPFRGLLESEVYAHVFISSILDRASEGFKVDKAAASRITDGIKLWLMIQKENQEWGNDAAYAEALCSVLEGSSSLLSTEVIVLSKSTELPFSEIKASGNGMSIDRSWYVERRGEDGKMEWRELEEGGELNVGDKIKAEYRIWNEENRSHVRISAGRPASVRPIDQLSGNYGWWLSPLRASGWYSFSPNGYRNVKDSMTEYWFDAYPEEKTTISEEFHVTQSGSFQSPVVTIESLYAPYYKANGKGEAGMSSH